MPEPPDPRVIKLMQELDEERRKRVAAEQRESALRGVLTRMKQQRTTDATKQERRAEC